MDCDPGIDDAVALALVAASPQLDLRAVTTARGNVPVADGTRNAARILRAVGAGEVPLAAGAGRPLVRTGSPHRPVHGLNGLGEVELPAAGTETGAGSAVALLEAVLEPAAPGEITVIALAPLSNLALLLSLRPDLADRIGLLAAMAGTIDDGNITPYAEFNVWADPEAAHRVLTEGDLPTRLFPLAATRRAAIDESFRRQLATWSPVGASLAAMIEGYDDRGTGAGWPLHDAMVVAGLLDPDIVSCRAATVGVDTSTGPRRGATTFAWDPPVAAPRPTEVAVDADPGRFRELLRDRISRLAPT